MVEETKKKKGAIGSLAKKEFQEKNTKAFSKEPERKRNQNAQGAEPFKKMISRSQIERITTPSRNHPPIGVYNSSFLHRKTSVMVCYEKSKTHRSKLSKSPSEKHSMSMYHSNHFHCIYQSNGLFSSIKTRCRCPLASFPILLSLYS